MPIIDGKNTRNAAVYFGFNNKCFVNMNVIPAADSLLETGTKFVKFSVTGSPTLMGYLFLPTNKGALKLWMRNFRLNVLIADASNYVNNTFVQGIKTDGTVTVLVSDLTNIDSAQLYVSDESAQDVSAYNTIVIVCGCVVATAANLEFAIPELELWYQ